MNPHGLALLYLHVYDRVHTQTVFEQHTDVDVVCENVQTRRRAEKAPVGEYLLSRCVAGTWHRRLACGYFLHLIIMLEELYIFNANIDHVDIACSHFYHTTFCEVEVENCQFINVLFLNWRFRFVCNLVHISCWSWTINSMLLAQLYDQSYMLHKTSCLNICNSREAPVHDLTLHDLWPQVPLLRA